MFFKQLELAELKILNCTVFNNTFEVASATFIYLFNYSFSYSLYLFFHLERTKM